MNLCSRSLVCHCLIALLGGVSHAQVTLSPIGRYDTGITLESACEIMAFDAPTSRLFVTNASANAIDVLTLVDPARPVRVATIDLSPFGGGVNSVAISDGLVAAAVEATNKQDPGKVVFFDTQGRLLHHIVVGALPDALAFSPDGRWLLTANEGEPNDAYTIDPPGSVSIISIPRDRREIRAARVRTAGFERYDLLGVPEGVRVFGPGAAPSQDIEPEYIAFDHRSARAFVACQENNAIAIIDLASAQVERLVPLGTKDHALERNAIDPDDRDARLERSAVPVRGFYMPDTLASYTVAGRTYLVSANEGDARDYPGYSEQARVEYLEIDPRSPAAEPEVYERIRRLRVTRAQGDTDGDGDHDELYSFGARSIAIWDDAGRLVWDSGSILESMIIESAAARGVDVSAHPHLDARSDDRGPEPEALAIGTLGGRTYAFCGLERSSGIAVFDITNPFAPTAVCYEPGSAFPAGKPADAGIDIAPECLVFVTADLSPSGRPLLIAAYEVSGSVVVYDIAHE